MPDTERLRCCEVTSLLLGKQGEPMAEIRTIANWHCGQLYMIYSFVRLKYVEL